MAKHSITAVFDTRAHADQAITELKSLGVPAGDITLLPSSAEMGSTTDPNREKGFWASLENLFGGTDDHATYAESLRRGGTMVSVNAEDDHLDKVVDILERHGSVDLDERETSWRSEGWTGHSTAASLGGTAEAGRSGLDISSPGMTAMGAGLGAGALGTSYEDRSVTTASTSTLASTGLGGVASTTETVPVVTDRTVDTRTTGGVLGAAAKAVDDVIQVVEERLDVGKRSVSRGKVRVRTSVVSRDVSEDVTLHAETVTVDRRPVDRPVSVAALDVDPFKERVIEMEEFSEEAVVAKSARVVEEIGITKDATSRTETVRDTVRSTVVDIDDGRVGETVTGTVTRFAGEIRDDMEVVGSDGLHVGIVDHVDGGRIKLKKNDASASGQHHYLSTDHVSSVAGKVMLAVTAAEAMAAWTVA